MDRGRKRRRGREGRAVASWHAATAAAEEEVEGSILEVALRKAVVAAAPETTITSRESREKERKKQEDNETKNTKHKHKNVAGKHNRIAGDNQRKKQKTKMRKRPKQEHNSNNRCTRTGSFIPAVPGSKSFTK